jgi:predicted transcriptional regulator
MKIEESFTENQRKIYEIAKEYLKKNPHFTYDELLSVCRRASKLPDKDVMKILSHFIRKKIFVPGSRLTRETVLKNEKRTEVYDLISKNPGLHFTEILNRAKIGPYAGRWHLEMLKKFGLIREQKITRYKAYFSEEFPKDMQPIVFALRHPTVLKIYLCLKNYPFTVTDLSKILDLHHSTIQYQLKKLVENDMVRVDADDQYTVNTEFLYFIGQFYDLILSPELSRKIASYTEAGKEAPEPPEGTVKVLREYDYFGGNIRFKVAVQNATKMTVSKIDIMMTATSQYTLDEKVRTIDHLVPSETRGVDFILTPLQCGKSMVYATMAYTDGYGKPQSAQVEPKEIWIKCPLVSPKKVMENQIGEWKKNLQKGTSTIDFESISPRQIFDVAHNQITALDLAEVIYDEDKLRCVFSGLAKVTSTKMMIEANVSQTTLVLDVWADSMKQATGFLAYIRNLINVALESARQLMGRVEQLGQKVLSIFEITNRIIQLFAYCEDLWIISEILIVLNEIKSRLNRILPDLEIIDQISHWVDNLQSKFNVGDSIRTAESIALQTSIQAWLNQLIRLAQSNLDNFSETFKEQDAQIKHFKSLLSDLKTKYQEIIGKIIEKILIHMIIIDKATGLCLYDMHFQELAADSDLMSGFLTAIQQFGKELSQETTSVKKIEYHGFEINLEDGNLTRAALVLKGSGPEILRKNLGTFIKEYEHVYGSQIENFKGDVSVFKECKDLIEKYFVQAPHEEK